MFRIKNCISDVVRYVSTTKSVTSPIRSAMSLAFGKYLLATNTVSSGVLMLIADVSQQEIEYRQKKLPERYDYGRLARMFTVGLSLAPVHHYFYIWIAKVMPARNIATVIKKIMIDQFIMSPIFIIEFFYIMGALELKSFRDCNEELKSKFAEVYMVDWCVWPPTLFINYYYIPVKYQVFYVNTVTMFYDIFLSFVKHRENAQENPHQIMVAAAKNE